MIVVDQIGPNTASRDYTELWETVVQKFPMLDNRQTAEIVSLVVGICASCYAAPKSCQCWNDE